MLQSLELGQVEGRGPGARMEQDHLTSKATGQSYSFCPCF